LPKINDSFLDAVVFLYSSTDDAEQGVRTGGSGFLVGLYSNPQRVVHLYVVTNRHVARSGFSAVRLTAGSGVTTLATQRTNETVIRKVLSIDDWIFPDGGDDLAAWHLGTQDPSNDNTFSYVSLDHYAVGEIHDYGPGDECFMLGRFMTKDGLQRNQPSARFGNISMLPQEPFEIEKDVLVDAFLVETRSQAGYSGSPVFVYRKRMVTEMPVREVAAYKRSVSKIDLASREEFDIRLLGIDFSHLPNLAPVSQTDDNGKMVLARQHPLLPKDARVELGSGMLAVVPAWKLVEMLNRPDVGSVRQAT
jgi:hypothetical protein